MGRGQERVTVLAKSRADIDTRTRQLVIAVLRAGSYLTCTRYDGVQRGEPIPVRLALKRIGIEDFPATIVPVFTSLNF